MTENRVGRPLTTGGVTIVPLEKVRLSRSTGRRGGTVYGSVEPVAVVVHTPDGDVALDLQCRRLALTDLVGQFAGLEETLSGL